ncbi:hypothetical protein HYH02_015220 [Chlamydomonas schloesseri]|uniref:USP domain-containing protein n=1 Tax=Chlamydomonas schloesseri TaxID=2026947 RepID=A0A835SPJ5_9CHLO|nr:hypothetical protein HYH02_015220 [Chlamydomonas schloesseri]|eukprot:KAG2424235.1 hypothetical protein HYH02_015220 [Chlamydomonas schloesseri]
MQRAKLNAYDFGEDGSEPEKILPVLAEYSAWLELLRLLPTDAQNSAPAKAAEAEAQAKAAEAAASSSQPSAAASTTLAVPPQDAPLKWQQAASTGGGALWRGRSVGAASAIVAQQPPGVAWCHSLLGTSPATALQSSSQAEGGSKRYGAESDSDKVTRAATISCAEPRPPASTTSAPQWQQPREGPTWCRAAHRSGQLSASSAAPLLQCTLPAVHKSGANQGYSAVSPSGKAQAASPRGTFLDVLLRANRSPPAPLRGGLQAGSMGLDVAAATHRDVHGSPSAASAASLSSAARPAGVVGLPNPSGTACSLNSILQALNAVPELVAAFCRPAPGLWSKEARVAPLISKLMQAMQSGQRVDATTVSDLWSLVTARMEADAAKQQDVHEVFTHLAGALQEEGAERSIMEVIFGFTMQSTLSCQCCGFASHSIGYHITVQVPTDGDHAQISEVMEAAFKEEKNIGARCPRPETLNNVPCGEKACVSKQLQPAEAPPVLAVMLQRVAHSSGSTSSTKTHTVVELGTEGLTMRYNRLLESGGSCPSKQQYKLFATINHRGRNTYEGHYYADVHSSAYDGKWYRCSDEAVAEVAPPSASDCAYMLLYRRVDARPPQGASPGGSAGQARSLLLGPSCSRSSSGQRTAADGRGLLMSTCNFSACSPPASTSPLLQTRSDQNSERRQRGPMAALATARAPAVVTATNCNPVSLPGQCNGCSGGSGGGTSAVPPTSRDAPPPQSRRSTRLGTGGVRGVQATGTAPVAAATSGVLPAANDAPLLPSRRSTRPGAGGAQTTDKAPAAAVAVATSSDTGASGGVGTGNSTVPPTARAIPPPQSRRSTRLGPGRRGVQATGAVPAAAVATSSGGGAGICAGTGTSSVVPTANDAPPPPSCPSTRLGGGSGGEVSSTSVTAAATAAAGKSGIIAAAAATPSAASGRGRSFSAEADDARIIQEEASQLWRQASCREKPAGPSVRSDEASAGVATGMKEDAIPLVIGVVAAGSYDQPCARSPPPVVSTTLPSPHKAPWQKESSSAIIEHPAAASHQRCVPICGGCGGPPLTAAEPEGMEAGAAADARDAEELAVEGQTGASTSAAGHIDEGVSAGHRPGRWSSGSRGSASSSVVPLATTAGRSTLEAATTGVQQEEAGTAGGRRQSSGCSGNGSPPPHSQQPAAGRRRAAEVHGATARAEDGALVEQYSSKQGAAVAAASSNGAVVIASKAEPAAAAVERAGADAAAAEMVVAADRLQRCVAPAGSGGSGMAGAEAVEMNNQRCKVPAGGSSNGGQIMAHREWYMHAGEEMIKTWAEAMQRLGDHTSQTLLGLNVLILGLVLLRQSKTGASQPWKRGSTLATLKKQLQQEASAQRLNLDACLTWAWIGAAGYAGSPLNSESFKVAMTTVQNCLEVESNAIGEGRSNRVFKVAGLDGVVMRTRKAKPPAQLLDAIYQQGPAIFNHLLVAGMPQPNLQSTAVGVIVKGLWPQVNGRVVDPTNRDEVLSLAQSARNVTIVMVLEKLVPLDTAAAHLGAIARRRKEGVCYLSVLMSMLNSVLRSASGLLLQGYWAKVDVKANNCAARPQHSLDQQAMVSMPVSWQPDDSHQQLAPTLKASGAACTAGFRTFELDTDSIDMCEYGVKDSYVKGNVDEECLQRYKPAARMLSSSMAQIEVAGFKTAVMVEQLLAMANGDDTSAGSTAWENAWAREENKNKVMHIGRPAAWRVTGDASGVLGVLYPEEMPSAVLAQVLAALMHPLPSRRKYLPDLLPRLSCTTDALNARTLRLPNAARDQSSEGVFANLCSGPQTDVLEELCGEVLQNWAGDPFVAATLTPLLELLYQAAYHTWPAGPINDFMQRLLKLAVLCDAIHVKMQDGKRRPNLLMLQRKTCHHDRTLTHLLAATGNTEAYLNVLNTLYTAGFVYKVASIMNAIDENQDTDVMLAGVHGQLEPILAKFYFTLEKLRELDGNVAQGWLLWVSSTSELGSFLTILCSLHNGHNKLRRWAYIPPKLQLPQGIKELSPLTSALDGVQQKVLQKLADYNVPAAAVLQATPRAPAPQHVEPDQLLLQVIRAALQVPRACANKTTLQAFVTQQVHDMLKAKTAPELGGDTAFHMLAAMAGLLPEVHGDVKSLYGPDIASACLVEKNKDGHTPVEVLLDCHPVVMSKAGLAGLASLAALPDTANAPKGLCKLVPTLRSFVEDLVREVAVDTANGTGQLEGARAVIAACGEQLQELDSWASQMQISVG